MRKIKSRTQGLTSSETVLSLDNIVHDFFIFTCICTVDEVYPALANP